MPENPGCRSPSIKNDRMSCYRSRMWTAKIRLLAPSEVVTVWKPRDIPGDIRPLHTNVEFTGYIFSRGFNSGETQEGNYFPKAMHENHSLNPLHPPSVPLTFGQRARRNRRRACSRHTPRGPARTTQSHEKPAYGFRIVQFQALGLDLQANIAEGHAHDLHVFLLAAS